MGKKPLIVLMFLCLLSSWGLAQQQGQGSSGTGDRGRPQPQQRRPDSQLRRPLFLSGKVILDDGGVPTEQAQVELVCQGTVIQQVYTSSGGAFSFAVNLGGGHNSQQPMDASVSSTSSTPVVGEPGGSGGLSINNRSAGNFGSTGYNSTNLSACELQAKLSGFRSDRIFLGPRRALDNPDVGIIVLHRTARAEGATVSLKTLTAPKEAKQAYEKALKELGKKKINFSKTSKELEKAVKIYPEFAAAWHVLGEVRLKLKDQPAARNAFEQALAADPHYANPYISLAMLELEEERWEEAARLCAQVLELDSQLVRAHYFNALANSSLGNLDVAEESALQVQKSSTAENYPFTHYILGWIMSQKGNFHFAAAEYRRFLELVPTAQITERLKDLLVQWEEGGLIPTSETPESQN